MIIILSLLFFISLACAFIGLINPKWVFCRNLSRFKTFAIFILISGVSFFLIGITASREFEKESQETAKQQGQDVKSLKKKSSITVQPEPATLAVKSQEEKQKNPSNTSDSQIINSQSFIKPKVINSSEEKQKDYNTFNIHIEDSELFFKVQIKEINFEKKKGVFIRETYKNGPKEVLDGIALTIRFLLINPYDKIYEIRAPGSFNITSKDPNFALLPVLTVIGEK